MEKPATWWTIYEVDFSGCSCRAEAWIKSELPEVCRRHGTLQRHIYTKRVRKGYELRPRR